MKVYKYDLSITDLQEISMPKGSKILTLQVQFDNPKIWALVNDNEPELEARQIRIYGTGHSITGNTDAYIGSFVIREGAFVGHAFEETATPTKSE